MIKAGSKVKLHYRLTYDTDSGEVIEETTKEDPVIYEHGQGEMLEAFEKKLEGKAVEDTFEFTLTPEQAYGPYHDQLVTEYPKENFMVDGELDEDFLQVGELVEMTDEEGNSYEGMIEENKVNSVVIDFNHPLAGETLFFQGVIIEVS